MTTSEKVSNLTTERRRRTRARTFWIIAWPLTVGLAMTYLPTWATIGVTILANVHFYLMGYAEGRRHEPWQREMAEEIQKLRQYVDDQPR